MTKRVFVLLCVLGFAAQSSQLQAQTNDTALAGKAFAILKTHCFKCHGQEASAKGGLGFILDRDRLIARGKIVAGNAAESEIYQRMHQGEMPPLKSPRPSAGEIGAIKLWIEAGAPALASAAQPRAFVSDPALRQAIFSDLQTVDPRQRRFMRYLTFTHLANAGLSDTDLKLTREALSKLINSLSWHARIARPVPVDTQQTIVRIDLRQYKWTATSWERLVSAYPYRGTIPSAEIKSFVATTGSEHPFLRGDWFIATASRPPLYHDLLQMPNTDRGLERLLQVDVLENLKEETVARAGFNDSGISKNNRLIERHDAAYGAYWRSYDFSANTNRQNLFEHPLGPNTGETSFAPAGGEMIFNLPNGLQGYMLVDGKGRRIDKAPGEIVADPKRPDQRVETGISCMSCHVRGLMPKFDQLRAHVDKNANVFTQAERDQVKALFPPKAKLQALFNEDIDRFVKALARAGVSDKEPEPEPIVTVTLRYEATLDLASVAAELGMREPEFLKRLTAAPSLVKILGAVKQPGGTVQRQVFQESFPEIARVLKLDEGTTVTTASAIEPFSGHTGAVLCIAFSEDGKQAASGGQDKTIRLWDVATGRELRRFDGHTAEVTALVFTPHGLLSAGRDRVLRLWNVADGTQIRLFSGHTDGVRCLAISPDGQRALSGGDDHTLRLWDLAKSESLRVIGGHERPVTSVQFAPNKRRAVSGSLDGTVRLWDTADGKLLKQFDGHVGEVYAVAISKNGKQILSGGNDRTVRLWNAATGQELRAFKGHVNSVIRVAFAADGRTALSGSSQYRQPDLFVRHWDLENGKQVAGFGGRDAASIAAIALSPDGRTALTGGADKSLRLWNWK